MLPDMLPDALLPHPLLRNATLRDGCAQTLQTCAEVALHMLSGIVEAVLTDALSTALGEADPSRLPHDANPSVMLAAAASLLFDVRDLQPPETASERDQAALHRAALALAAHRSDDARAAFSAADWAAGMCLPDKLPWPELLRQAWLLGWRHLIAHWVQPERASLAELGALIEGARAHGGPTDADADALLAEAGGVAAACRMLAFCASIRQAAHLGEQGSVDMRVLASQDREARRHALAGAGDADLHAALVCLHAAAWRMARPEARG